MTGQAETQYKQPPLAALPPVPQPRRIQGTKDPKPKTKPSEKSDTARNSVYKLNDGGQDMHSYRLQKIEKGRFGRVYLHSDSPNGNNPYSVKVVILPGNELRILALLGRLHYYFTIEKEDEYGNTIKKYYMAMRYVPGVNVQAYIQQYPLTPVQFSALLLAMCRAVIDLHKNGIIHNDLKLPNMVVDPRDPSKVTLIDFANSCQSGQQVRMGLHPDGYYPTLAPEIHDACRTPILAITILNTTPTGKSDIFSLGVTLDYALRSYENKNGRLPSADDYRTLIAGMTQKDPADRLTLSDVEQRLSKMHQEASENQPIEADIKKDVLRSLRNYLENLKAYIESSIPTYLSVLIFGSNASKKREYIEQLVKRLEDERNKNAFIGMLIDGFVGYVKTFVSLDLKHYLDSDDLGKGVMCFTDAIAKCGENISMKDVRARLDAAVKPAPAVENPPTPAELVAFIHRAVKQCDPSSHTSPGTTHDERVSPPESTVCQRP